MLKLCKIRAAAASIFLPPEVMCVIWKFSIAYGPLEEHAFPVLYPKGRFGLGYARSKSITDLKYMQSRLFNKDSRWRDNVVWLFWALNTFEMKKLQNEISILSRIKKQNNQPLTAGDLTNPSSESLNNSYMFMRNIRGTAAYWKDQLLDLLARINTLGPPTFS